MKHLLSATLAVAFLAAAASGAQAKNPEHAEDPAVVSSQGTAQLPEAVPSTGCGDSVVMSSSNGVPGLPENKANLRDGAGASGVPDTPDCQSLSASSLPDLDAGLPNNTATERESE